MSTVIGVARATGTAAGVTVEMPVGSHPDLNPLKFAALLPSDRAEALIP